MATIFVNPGWNNGDNPITVYILNGYVYKTDPGEGSSTALCYNKLGAENNDDMKGAVSAASDGDTIYVYNDPADSLSLSTPSGTYCPPGLYELYLNRSTASQKNLAVWANKLQLGEKNSYIKLGDNGISISMDFHVSDSFVVGSGKSFSVLNGSSFSISKIEQVGTNSVSFTNNGSIDVSNSTFAADTVETSANTASFLVSGTSKLTIGSFVGTITTLFATLNASSITGGSISAQNDLTFTGANTLNDITLDATDRTVTVGTGNSDSLTVGDTSTLNIGTLNGEIKTGSAGTTLNASSITGGGTNGGTITALGNLTFTNNTHLRNITLDAHDQTVNAGSYNLRVGGTSTLNIGTLSGAIWLNNGATVSKSTISGGGGGGLFIYDNTPVIFAGENQVNAGWTYEGHYTSIANCGLITVKSIPASGDNPNALDYVPAQRGVLKAIDIWNKGSITAGSANAENADACSIEVTNLTNTNNNSSLTVTCNAESANPSRLKATQGIVNNGMMTLTNSELTAKTLTNNGSGISQSTAGMTISNSTVSASGENPLVITNGNSNTFATIEFNKSTVTAGQVTNFSFHNGQDPTWGTWGLVVTNQSFFSVTDLSNTGWIQVTDSTLSATSVYIGKIDNERNYSGKLQVNGTSTLDIASLEGTITIGSSYFPDPITLTGSTITGKVDNGNRLGNISVTNPLTFTGENTLRNISLATTNCGAVTVGTNEGDSLTVKGTSSLNIDTLNGTILTDSEAATTLTGSSITGGTISAQNSLTFTGENTLRNITLNATNKNVTNNGTLTVGGTLSFDGDLNVAGNASLAVGNGAGMSVTGNISNSGSITVTGTGSLSVTKSNVISNDNGTITVDALSKLEAKTVSGGVITVLTEGLVLTEDVYHVVDANLQNVDNVVIGELTGYTIPVPFDSGVYLFKEDPSTVYVNRDYQGTLTFDGNLVGVNAFTDNPDGTGTPLHFSNNTEKIVYYANENAYAALNLASAADAPASLTITTEAVGNNEVVTMGPLTVGAGQTVTLSGAKMSLQTVNNAGTINVTNSTFAASTVSTSAVDDRFCVVGESTLNIDSLNGKIKLNDGATVSNSTVYSDVNVGETTTSCSGRLVIATGSSVTFAGANTFRDSNNEKGIEIGNLGSVTVKSIAASGDDPAASDYVPAQRGVLKVFGFDNNGTLTVGSDTDACTFDVINLNNYHALTVNGKTDDLSRLKASLIKNYGTIELTNAIAEAGSLQNGNDSNKTTTIGIANSEFTADSVTNYSSGISNVREGMTVINSTLFRANSLVNTGTIKFRGKNKLDIASLNGTLYFDVAEGTQATLNDSSITGGTLQAVSVMKFTGANTLTNITVDAAYMGVTVGTDEGDSLTVYGTNTLNIGTLNGEIKTAGGVTLTGANITGGAITALGSVTVNNSTISSNTFTATVYGADFYGACILNGVTLDAGSQSVKIGEGNTDSLTVSGTSTLKTSGLEGSRTIKLDDAEIVDSWIGGMSGNGGTLLVESGKTATFSTTESKINNLSKTSIENSGTITVNGSMVSGTNISGASAITNSGTITVNGTLNSGAITNTSGTITVNGTLNSGAITNTSGTINVTNSAFTVDGELTNNTDAKINVTDSTFSADSVYTAATGYDFTVSGTSTLNIGTLVGVIKIADGATISNSTVYADVSKGETPTYQGYLRITGSSITFAGANTFLSDDGEKGISLSNDNGASATVKSTSNQKGELKAYFINNNNLGGNLTVGSETDACSLDAIALYNRGAITVQGNKNDQERSKVFASEIKNEDANARMTLNYSELTATTLKNYGHGTTAQAGIAITDSTVSITDSLTNGLSTETEATIEFNDSTVTAVSVMNYGKINMTNSKFDAASVVNNNNGFGSFTVKGTSTLDIGSLDGKITIANPGNFETPITLTGSTITGKVENGNRLGIIDIRDPLTFTGTNTLTNITVDATANYGSVTVGTNEGDSLTVKGTSTLNIGNLDGTILTDSAATTTLTASSITGGTISAQDALTFTGANTLNRVTLTATDKTVTVDSGATLTVGGTSTLNIGTLSGTITVANGATLSNSTIGGTVKVQSGATLTLDGVNAITTLDLSEATGVVMDWQDQLSFTGFGTSTSYTDKLTINLNNFTAGDLSKPILDYTGSPDGKWTKAMYEDLLTNAWSSSDQGSTQYTFKVVNGDLYLDLQEIVVKGNRTYDSITVLNGIDSIIEDGSFERGVMGGDLVTEADAVNVGSLSMTVNGGTYEKLLGAGDCVNPAEDGATTSAIRCARSTGEGSEITYEKTTVNFTITGGIFEQHVAGGMEYMDTTPVSGTHNLGYSKLYGDINLNISGGEFLRYLYGGSVAANKSISGCTEIVGNVTITIDATDPELGTKTIKLNRVICGSYNVGTIAGSTKLVLTGNADNLVFLEGGEIWGGCGGDYYKTGTPGEREFQSNVTDSRTLSFTGFSGTLNANCTKIRGFSDIEFFDNSVVTLARTDYNLSDVENWEFEYDAGTLAGSSLAGCFANNFTNDTLTLNLNGLDLSGLSDDDKAAWEWTVMENTSTAEGAFNGFGGTGDDILQVFLKNGNDPISMGWDVNQSCYFGGGYELALEDDNKLVLTLA